MLRSELENNNIIRGRGEATIPTELTVTDYVLNTVPDGIVKSDLSKDAVMDVVTGEKLSYLGFRQQISQIASGLINNYHLKRGDVVALFSPNHIHFPTVLLATLSVGMMSSPDRGYQLTYMDLLGIIVTTVNSNYTAQEVSYQLDHSKAKLIVAYHEIANVAKEAIDNLDITIPIVSIDNTENLISEPFHHLLSDQPYEKLIFKEGECHNTDAIIIYSSGTTGVPKGIISSHYNLIASMVQSEPYIFRDNINTKYIMGNSPFYHAYGACIAILQGIHRHVTLLPIKKFDPKLFLGTIEKFRLDFLLLTPPLILFLAQEPIVDKYDLSSVKRIITGGSTLPYEVFRRAVNRLGCEIDQAYGMTECSPSVAIPDTDGMSWGSVGRLLPGMSAKVVHPDTKEIINFGDKGELWLRGPNIMKGYLKNDKANRAIFDSEGYMCTGDIAYFDDDKYLYIFDRSSELIKYHHHRISPSYLESILLTHPAILDCCVVGIPHSPTEEYPRAYLVLDPDTDPTNLIGKIETYTRSKLEPHEYIRGGFKIVPRILKSPAGKILRQVMRDQSV